MELTRRHALGGVGIVSAVVALVILNGDVGLGRTAERVALAASVAAAGLSLGCHQYYYDVSRDGGERPFFGSPSLYVGFWALHWAAFVLLLGSYANPDVEPPFDAASTQLALASILGSLWVVAVVRGGVNPAVNPLHWARQYREGKRKAKSE